jgi:hypothetical protein
MFFLILQTLFSKRQLTYRWNSKGSEASVVFSESVWHMSAFNPKRVTSVLAHDSCLFSINMISNISIRTSVEAEPTTGSQLVPVLPQILRDT